MTYELHVNQHKIPISGYLAVQPFKFDQQAQYIALTDEICVIVNVCQTQHQTRDFPAVTADLPEWDEFSIKDGNGNTILTVDQYTLRLAATPHSVDMGRAIWVLTPRRDNPESTINFTPPSVHQSYWNAQGHSQYFWGGEVKEGSTQLLRASLSVPTYERWNNGDWYLREYLAAGPANAQGGDGHMCLFKWFAKQWGGKPARVSELALRDVRRSQENKIFGRDELNQVGVHTRGAAFALNGRLLEVPWPELQRIVREIAMHDSTSADYAAIVRAVPVTAVDQSLLACDGPENRSSASLGIQSVDFEGIAIWGMNPRSNEPAAPMHF